MAEFRSQERDRSGNLISRAGESPGQRLSRRLQTQGQRLSNDDDRVFTQLSYLLLAGVATAGAGALALAAVKHFPTARVKGLSKEIKDILSNPERFGVAKSVLGKLRSAMDTVSDVIVQQPWAHVHKSRMGNVLGNSRAANDPDVNQAIRIIVDIAESNPKNFTDIASITRAKPNKFLRPIPQDSTNVRSLTMADLFDSSGGYRSDIWGKMPEKFQNIQTQLTRLSKIAGTKGSRVTRESVDEVFKMTVDPGLYARRAGGLPTHLVDLSYVSPSKWIQSIGATAESARAGGFMHGGVSGKAIAAGALGGAGLAQISGGDPTTGAITGGIAGALPVGFRARLADWTIQHLVPSELANVAPQAAILGRQAIKDVFPNPTEAVTGGLYFRGQLFPMVAGPRSFLLGKPVEGSVILGRQWSRTGAGARIRWREQAEQEAAALYRESPYSGIGHLPPKKMRRFIETQDKIEGLRRQQSARAGVARNRPAWDDVGDWDWWNDAGGVAPAGGDAAQLLTQQKIKKLYGERFQIYSGSFDYKHADRKQWYRGPEDLSGATARYLHANQIDPYSLKGRAVRFGEKLGIGPQYSVGNIVRNSDILPGTDIDSIPGSLWSALARPDKFIKDQATALGGRGASPLGGQYYATTKGQAVGDWANYLVNRVGRLLEQTTHNALAIQPGSTAIGTLSRWVGLGVGAAGAAGALQYADYWSRNVTSVVGAETGPLTLPVQAYAAARVGVQKGLELTGIQQSASYLEGLMPGLIDSGLSRLARTAATFSLLTGRGPLGFLGVKAGMRATRALNLPAQARRVFGAKGQLVGTALALSAALINMTDVTETSEHLAGVYSGDIDIKVRQARWWSLGSQPFGGGRVMYERPHWLPTHLSRARTIGRYGSEAESWRNSFLPTPESWFGTRPLLDPYRVEKQNYLTRPYPLTGPMFSEVPFIGPALAATVGEVLKPTQKWHQAYWQGGQLVEPGAGGIVAPPSVARPDLMGRSLQAGQVPINPAGTSPVTLPAQGIEDAAAALGYQQVAGLPRTDVGHPGSVREVVGKQIDVLRDFLGMPGFLAGAIKSKLTGQEDFNSANRQIETAGRITSNERAYYEQQLGGALGMTELVRRFQPHRRRQIELVNPIPNQMAEWLPGTYSAFGRDRTSRVDFHRGDPYTKVDFGEARLPGIGYEVLHRLNSGIPSVYDPYDRWKILRDVAPSSQAFRNYDTLVRAWAKAKAFDVKSEGKLLEAPRAPIDPLSGMELRGQPTAAQEALIWDTQRNLTKRFQPYPFTERIFDDPSAAVPRNMRQLATRTQEGINRAIKKHGEYNRIEKLVGRAWEAASHITLPGPLNWPVNKLFAQRDALEVYGMQVRGGMEFGDWKTPVESFLEPWMHQAQGAVNSDFIQPRLQRQRMVEQGLDLLQFAKMRRLEKEAKAVGRKDLASDFRRKQMRTVTGSLVHNNRRAILAGLPKIERGFWKSFVAEQNLDKRQSILGLVPQDMGIALRQEWGYDVQSEVDEREAMATRLEQDVPNNWAGWHPDFPLTSMKMRVANREGWDIHDFGFASRDQYLAKELFANYMPISEPQVSFSPDLRAHAYNMGERLQLQGVQVSMDDSPGSARVELMLKRDQRKFYELYDKHSASGVTGMRF